MRALAIQIAQALMGDTAPALSPKAEGAIARLDAWIVGAPQGKWKPTPADVAARLKQLVANPAVIDDEPLYGWCMPNAFLYIMLKDRPLETVEFALKLYETGKSTLGKLAFAPDAALIKFDYPHYKTVGYGLTHSGKKIGGDTVDFMLLGSIVDAANTFIDFEGPVEDGYTSFSSSYLGDLLKSTGFAEVDICTLRQTSDADLLIAQSSIHRIVLTGPIRSFGGTGVGYHAAPMTTPISHQLTGEGYTFRIWSTHVTDYPLLAERDLSFVDKASLRTGFSDFITIKYRER